MVYCELGIEYVKLHSYCLAQLLHAGDGDFFLDAGQVLIPQFLCQLVSQGPGCCEYLDFLAFSLQLAQ